MASQSSLPDFHCTWYWTMLERMGSALGLSGAVQDTASSPSPAAFAATLPGSTGALPALPAMKKAVTVPPTCRPGGVATSSWLEASHQTPIFSPVDPCIRVGKVWLHSIVLKDRSTDEPSAVSQLLWLSWI